MSRQEIRKGEIRKVENIEGEFNYDKKILQILSDAGYEPIDGETPEESLMEYQYDDWCGYRWMMLNGDLYEFLEDEEFDEGGFTEMSRGEDGSINYFVSWYNGGTSLGEMLEEGLKKL